MDKADFNKIFDKISDGSANEQEIELYLNWYKSFADQKDMWKEMNEDPRIFKQELFAKILQKTERKPEPILIKPNFKPWRRIFAAASIVALFGIGYFFYQHKLLMFADPDKVGTSSKINSVTLTLPGGEKIDFSEADDMDQANANGVKISKSENGELIYSIAGTSGTTNGMADEDNLKFSTLSTPSGETCQLRLQDGSIVWLNARSTLVFPSSFSAKERRVQLSGEGYFEVAKSRSKPFIVESKDQEVLVLGTHFNIQAYDDDANVRTTLLEGSVKVKQKNTPIERILMPGQQTFFDSHVFRTIEIDPDEAIAWKSGLFVFNNERLGSISKKLSRWYNVEFEATNEPALMNQAFSGTVSRFSDLDKVLEVLELTGAVKFKIEGRRVIVMK